MTVSSTSDHKEKHTRGKNTAQLVNARSRLQFGVGDFQELWELVASGRHSQYICRELFSSTSSSNDCSISMETVELRHLSESSGRCVQRIPTSKMGTPRGCCVFESFTRTDQASKLSPRKSRNNLRHATTAFALLESMLLKSFNPTTFLRMFARGKSWWTLATLFVLKAKNMAAIAVRWTFWVQTAFRMFCHEWISQTCFDKIHLSTLLSFFCKSFFFSMCLGFVLLCCFGFLFVLCYVFTPIIITIILVVITIILLRIVKIQKLSS